MALISIKRYLDASPPEAHLRMLELLIETVAEHPADIDRSECERFKSEVAKIRRPLAPRQTGNSFRRRWKPSARRLSGITAR